MGKIGRELFEKDKTLFQSFGPKEWMEYYESLNGEVPVDKIRLELSENEKKCYVEDLKELLADRKIIPGIRYEVNYKDVE